MSYSMRLNALKARNFSYKNSNSTSTTSGASTIREGLDTTSPAMIDVTCPLTEVEWEGYIYKQGKIVKTWTPRYVTLQNGLVTYYKSKKHAVGRVQARGSWFIKEVLDSLPSSGFGGSKLHSNTLGFSFLATNGNYVHFIAISPIEKAMWIHMMRKCGKSEQYTTNLIEGKNVEIDTNVRDFENQMSNHINGSSILFEHLIQILSVPTTTDLMNYLPLFVQHLSQDAEVKFDFETLDCSKYGSPNGIYYAREGFVHIISIYRNQFLLQVNENSVSKVTKNDDETCELTACHKLLNIATSTAVTGRLSMKATFSASRRISKINISFRVSLSKSARESASRSKNQLKRESSSRQYTLDSHPQNFHLCFKTKRALAMSFHDFDILGVLGQGGFGTVILVKRHTGGEYFAIKVIEKNSGASSALKERRILSTVRHPFLARLRFAFQTETKLYLGLDFYTGGNLYYHMHSIKNAHNTQYTMECYGGRRFDVARAKFYAAELCLAFSYLHSHGIIYRDLKPDNIMLDELGHIRLVDFGISKQLCEEQPSAGTLAGSPAYIAPEQLNTQQPQYGIAADWWSFGVFLYEMLRGMTPFHDNNIAQMYKKIQTATVQYDMHPPLPDDAKDLLQKLLVRDPAERIGFQEIRNHPFFSDIDWIALLQKNCPTPFMPSTKEVFENVTQHFQKMDVNSLNETPSLNLKKSNHTGNVGGSNGGGLFNHKKSNANKQNVGQSTQDDAQFSEFSFSFDNARRSSVEYYNGLVAQLQETFANETRNMEKHHMRMDSSPMEDFAVEDLASSSSGDEDDAKHHEACEHCEEHDEEACIHMAALPPAPLECPTFQVEYSTSSEFSN